MSNVILVDPFPGGKSIESAVQVIRGSVLLAGSAVSTGEPLNWGFMTTGVGYNEINRVGDGQHGHDTALVTTFAASAGVITATANNNFIVGQQVTFAGNTSTLGLLLNGVTVTVATCSATQFTFTSASVGTGTGEVGFCYTANSQTFPLQGGNAAVASTVTALSASSTTLTVTAANNYLPGAQVLVSVATGTLGPKLANLSIPVIFSTGTAFTATMPSALTGTTGTGTASAIAPPIPFSVSFWSELASGYTYAYSRTTGVLFAQVGAASASLPNANLAAGVYPSGVLGDVIRYEAYFAKA